MSTAPAPATSFVVPTHGTPELVLDALESIKAQTVPVAEIVVAVDGWPDLTSDAVSALHPDVKVLPPVGHTGEAATRNRGILAATGDWIFFLDGDDLAHRERVARTLQFIADHPGCHAVRAPFWVFASEDGAPERAWGMRRDFVARDLVECHERARHAQPRNDFSYLDIAGRSRELLLVNNRGAISTTAVDREVLLAAGLPPAELRQGVDWTLFVKVSRLTEWLLIPEPLGFQRLHARQDTQRGGVALAHGILDAKIRVWSTELEFKLADYGVEYRDEIHHFVATEARKGEWREAARLARTGFALLPRWSDRIAMLLPRRLTVRSAPRAKSRTVHEESIDAQ